MAAAFSFWQIIQWWYVFHFFRLFVFSSSENVTSRQWMPLMWWILYMIQTKLFKEEKKIFGHISSSQFYDEWKHFRLHLLYIFVEPNLEWTESYKEILLKITLTKLQTQLEKNQIKINILISRKKIDRDLLSSMLDFFVYNRHCCDYWYLAGNSSLFSAFWTKNSLKTDKISIEIKMIHAPYICVDCSFISVYRIIAH